MSSNTIPITGAFQSAAPGWIVGRKDHPDANVTIRVNPDYVSRITKRTQPYKNLPNWVRPGMEAIASYIRTEIVPRTFRAEGPGWQNLSKWTQADRRRSGHPPAHPILIRTGDLYAELTHKFHPHHVETITTGKRSTISIGGSSNKFIMNQLGGKNLPSRPMIDKSHITARDRKVMGEMLRKAIVDRINRRQS